MRGTEHLQLIDAGAGITLELLDEPHAAETFTLITQNREHLSRWLPWVTHMQTVDDFRAYIRACQYQHREGTDYGFVIKADGVIAGRIGVHYIQPQNKSGAIGYWLGQAFEGRGLVTRSCRALIDHCFEELCLNRLEIKCGVGNEKSAAVPVRLGFTREGVLRQAEWLNDGFVDIALFSLLKEEWQIRR